MKATITSTDRVVTIPADVFEHTAQARVWEGMTEGGVPFVAYVALIQVAREKDQSQFERELVAYKEPNPAMLRAINMRFII